MHKGFQNAINRGLGNIGPLVDGFERKRALLILQQLKNVERLREYRDQVKPLGS